MNGTNLKNTPRSITVVPFYGAAACFFLILCVLLFFSTDTFTGHYFHPKLLAITHIVALGWGTMIIFGASYQLLPVIFEKKLFNERVSFISFILLVSGTILLVFNFWYFSLGIFLQLSACTVFVSISLFAINIFLTAKGTKFSIQKQFIITSLFWLLTTVSVGVLLVFNFTFTYFSQEHLLILKLHAHLGIVGWFLLLIIGVGTKLFPMFLLGKSSKEILLQWAYYLINFGLSVFIIDGFFNGITFRSGAYSIIIISGIVIFVLYMYDIFKNRMRKNLDFPMKQSTLSFVFLIGIILLIPIILLKKTDFQYVLVYGFLIFMGWITSLILGMTFKTLPFIIWNICYKDHVGKVKIPMPKDLYNENLVKWQFFIYMVGIILWVSGILIQTQWVMKLATIMMIIVSLIYNINVFKIIFHKPKLKYD